MPYVTSREILKKAQEGGYAIGAFNVENMEMAQAVIEAAEELKAPVILQTTPSTIRYASVGLYHAMVKYLADCAAVPVVLHLDHGDSFELDLQAMEAGYASVMIDGSHGSWEENIALTGRVAEAAKKYSVPVEAELGKVGGKEDDRESEGNGYTDPDEAREFVRAAGVDSLAVAIGTAHGVYHGVPKLDLERLAEIRKRVSVPLVLHGASGLSDESVRACIARGICKVNFATELRIAYSDGVRDVLARQPDVFDPKKYGAAAREKVKKLVQDRMTVCGCLGKA